MDKLMAYSVSVWTFLGTCSNLQMVPPVARVGERSYHCFLLPLESWKMIKALIKLGHTPQQCQYYNNVCLWKDSAYSRAITCTLWCFPSSLVSRVPPVLLHYSFWKQICNPFKASKGSSGLQWKWQTRTDPRDNCSLISLEGKLQVRTGGGRCFGHSLAGRRLVEEQQMLHLGTAFSTRVQSIRGES